MTTMGNYAIITQQVLAAAYLSVLFSNIKSNMNAKKKQKNCAKAIKI
jgi:hypothetical protein